MNINNLRNTLESLKGKSFEYGGSAYVLESFTINANLGKVSLQTDRRYFSKSVEEMEEFLSLVNTNRPEPEAGAVEVLPETPAQDVPATTHKPFANEDTALVDEMIQIRKGNIQKVTEDKSYIPQAQAINNNINSIINLTKLKLDVYKQFKGKQ